MNRIVNWRFAAGLALALLCALQLFCLLRAPAAFSPSRIDLTLMHGQSQTLGRLELAAPQADSAHIVVRRDASGGWWIRNTSIGRQLALRRDGVDRLTGRTSISTGMRFQIGAAVFTVDGASEHEVAFSDGAQQWRYNGANLFRNGQVLPTCPDTRLAARIVAGWNRWVPAVLSMHRPLRFGGSLHCGNRIGVAGIAPGSAAMADDDGQLVLVAGAGTAPLLVWPGNGQVDLARREEWLGGTCHAAACPPHPVTSMVVGYTRLLMAVDGDTLRMRPVSHVALFAEPRLQLPPQVAWQWQQRDFWSFQMQRAWLAACAATVIAAVVTALRIRTQQARLRAGAAVFLAAAGTGALVLQHLGSPPGLGWSLILAWAALWFALLAAPRVNPVLAAGVTLLAVGLLAQLELALGGANSSWTRYFHKTSALLAIGLGAVVWVLGHRPRVPLPQASAERILLLLAGVALIALALQVAYGDETGVLGLQPVEFAKLALTGLTAHCIALGLGTRQQASDTVLRWLRLVMPALLFLALLGVALVQVDDYSPLVLLMVWTGAMVLAWTLATRRFLPAGILAACACCAVLALAALHGAEPARLAKLNFYADRFLVWLDPGTHPHTGQQLLLGARAIAQGGWRGADGLLGLSTLGLEAGTVPRIPQVQDDFAPSFFLNRHGLAAALALWTLQALFLAGLVQSAARAWQAHHAARDFRHAWLARCRCFALCGGAGFLFGHFLLSWGTNLSIFPVMGQPMSFLSAGGSHLLFFICPLLAIGSACVQSFEESHHAGVRPT
ncbi:FtsW/RodA/SpoVE family cell cycle protein [Massilia horti]|uniref:Probable peptidoglycan glycosyltransferase FtsW n=1 Tax=Massilia horti TaxID=2562153 RepID=A0A4Y9T1V8_9BURK|nr:FtsW/RodA/SpoVE family cell cycle protein [Massilia horti]TFW31879.1 hypothetical protein E4O92_12195 [Massilia horti]